MFKMKTSLIQGFAALLITSSSLWATPNHDDDNAKAVVSRGMEAKAIQDSGSIHTSPSTNSTSTDLSTTASDCHVTSFLAVTVSEGVIASAARQSTDLVTADKVWPPKWSPIEDDRGGINLPRLVLDEIFQLLLSTGDVDNVKNAAFLNRYWHRYTQSLEFKNLFLNALEATTGGDSGDAPDHPEQLFKGHRTYFKTFGNVRVIEFFKNRTFAGALEITSPWGQHYRTDYEKTRRVAHNPRKTSLSLFKTYNGNEDLVKSLRLSPTVHFDLGKLTCLNLKGNKLKILPDLTRMTNLQVLNLESNDLMELPHLGTLTNLKALLLGSNFFTEIPGLSALSQLKALDVSDTPLAHLEGLENLSGLRSFTAVWHAHLYYNLDDKDATWGPRGNPKSNTLKNLSALEHLTALRDLTLQGFMVSEFPPLTRLTNLESLYLENLGISEVPGLENLTSLQKLWLKNYKSPDFANKEIPVSQYYSANKFTSLPNLSRLINLQALTCEHLNLGQISGLGSLTKLKKLALSGIQLTRLEGLEKLVKLHSLYIYENPIESLPDLRSLQNLCSLSVQRTPLTALEGLDQLTSLRSIYYSDNHEQAPAIMSSLDRLTRLQVLRNVPVLSIYSYQ